MNLKQKILDVVKRQATATAELNRLQDLANEHQATLQATQGQIALLEELTQDEHGMTIQEMIEQDEEFKVALSDATRAGREAVAGVDNAAETAKRTEKPPPPPLRNPESKLSPVPKTNERAGNRQLSPTRVGRGDKTHEIVVEGDPPNPPANGQDED